MICPVCGSPTKRIYEGFLGRVSGLFREGRYQCQDPRCLWEGNPTGHPDELSTKIVWLLSIVGALLIGLIVAVIL